MKVALIAPSSVPFTLGGAEKLWWGLQHQVNGLTDHQLELIKLPSPERSASELLSSYRRFSELDLSHFDCVISTKYPAWMVAHPDHRLYLQHPLRGLYDTYPWPGLVHIDPFVPEAWPHAAGRQAIRRWRHHPLLRRLRRLLAASPERAQLPELFATLEALQGSSWLPRGCSDALLAFPGPLLRAVVHHLDAIAVAPDAISHYAAISRTVTRRAHYFPRGVPIKVIHHPSDLPVFESAPLSPDQRPYLFTVSRLDGPKRIELLVRAFMASQADLELRIAGTGPEEKRLRSLAADDPRIRFLGFLRDSQVVAQYRQALAVPFLPYDEDYGLVTVEAMAAGKPVMTCEDAGGVTELVRHGENGWCVPPQPAALAAVIDALGKDPSRAQVMADAARRSVAHIRWENTVKELLEAPTNQCRGAFPWVRGRGEGEHWLVLNTYAVYPPMGGGQNRMYHLYRHLAAEPGRQITLLVLVPVGSDECRQEIAPGLIEHRVPMSRAQQQALEDLEKALGVPAEDIAAIDGWRDNHRFVELLKRYVRRVTLGVAAHPYLAEALHEHLEVPWGYESHNVEALLKRDILAEALAQGEPQAQRALARVAEVEALACRESAWVSACAEEDLASFRQRYGLAADKGTVVPNGADLERLPFIDQAQRRRWQRGLGQHRPVALFLGSWHGPNLEAARRIVERFAPACPEVDFLLAGSLCQHPDFSGPFSAANVRALGRVSEAELSVLLASADVALNPMTSGSGSNLKMLDYTASGVPVLTTPFGNRGFAFDARHLWLADPETMVLALQRLLALPAAQRQSRVISARRLTEQRYAWPTIAQAVSSAVIG